MNEQLNQVYSLIKQGQSQAAVDMLEPIIRNDRDNEDAWWLLANAASDPEAKRNALNSVLRLSNNETRKNKAQIMLQRIDSDPFDFDIEPSKKQGMSAYQELDEVPQKQSSGLSCSTITLIVVGFVGVCALFSCFGLYSAAGGIFQAMSFPENYDGSDAITTDTTITNYLSADSPRDTYLYEGTVGDEINITVDYDSFGSPSIVIFEEDTTVPPTFSLPVTSGEATVSYPLPESGLYIITINGYEFLGQEFGYGEYTMEFEVR